MQGTITHPRSDSQSPSSDSCALLKLIRAHVKSEIDEAVLNQLPMGRKATMALFYVGWNHIYLFAKGGDFGGVVTIRTKSHPVVYS